MDEKKFSALCAAFKELNDSAALEDLRAIREHVESGTFFVSFIGQYSAGKSSLINNLLCRQILPGGRVETTPLLTYILYGDEEGGRLFYLDGNTEDIDLDTVMMITQSNRVAAKLENVEHLEIFLREEMLADGMILLDTPGINTLIQQHERLLANSLLLSSAIIYVVSGAPSRVDIEKLQEFAAQGFPISFVRTHCDEIREWEESYRQVVSSDEDVLRTCDVINALENRFFISNVADSKYFSGIEDIRELLRNKGKNVRKELERGTSVRLKVLTARAVDELRELNATLAQQKTERDTTIENRRKKIDTEITKLRGVLEERRKRLKSEVETCQAELKRNLTNYAQSSGDKAAKIIEAAGSDVKTNADMEDYARRKIRPILNQAFEIINLQISPILKDINGVLQVGGDFKTVGVDALIEDLPELSSYSEVVNVQDNALDELRRNLAALQKNREELQLQLSTADNDELQIELAELERDLAALRNDRKELGNYKAHMIEVDPGSSGGSEIGRTIGNILDWATLLIPVGGMTKVVTKPSLLKRIATMPVKLAKGAKAFLFGEKVTKTYATASRIAKAKNFMVKGIQFAGKAKEVGILDYLSLEHWGEKLGSKFDRPPRYEEDATYKQEFFARKRQIEQNILQKQQELFRRKEKLGAFRNEQERKAARLKSLEVDERELNRQLKSQEERLKRDGVKKAHAQWKSQWAQYYREVLPKFLIAQTEQYLADLPERLEAYQAHRFASLEEKLIEKKAEYESLVNMREDDVARKYQQTTEILRNLEGAGGR